MDETKKRLLKKWTKDLVLEEISKAIDRSAKYNQKTKPNLYGAAVRYFGSWRAAVEAVGLQYSDVTKRKGRGHWTEERITSAIKALPEKHSSSVRKKNPDLYSAALRAFGSWKDAVEASGIDYAGIRRAWKRT